MKRFDKGYIYSALLSDFFGCLVILFIFLKDFFLDDEAKAEDIIAAIPFFAIAFIVIFLCFIVDRIMYYKTSGYELTETEIKCKRGVFFRKRSVLEYRKVHAINKKQNLFHRIFRIAVLTVDSGSTNTSGQAEITIIEKEDTYPCQFISHKVAPYYLFRVSYYGCRINVEIYHALSDGIAEMAEEFVDISSGEIEQYSDFGILQNKDSAYQMVEIEKARPGSFSKENLATNQEIIEKLKNISSENINSQIAFYNSEFIRVYETKYRALLQSIGSTFETLEVATAQEADRLLNFDSKSKVKHSHKEKKGNQNKD